MTVDESSDHKDDCVCCDVCRDLATMDDDGYVMIDGRIKDTIIRGGENIYPVEVEQFLYKHSKIADVQVLIN